MKKEPEDLVFEKYGNKIRFAAWYMAYDKGANAGIQLTIKTEAGDSRQVDPSDIFGHKTSAVISIQDMMSQLSYKDLMDLSEWAKTAAKFVKKHQIKYRGVDDFAKEHMVNNLKVVEK